MILNGVMALILRYFIDFGSFRARCIKVVEDVVKNSRSLSHLLITFLLNELRLALSRPILQSLQMFIIKLH